MFFTSCLLYSLLLPYFVVFLMPCLVAVYLDVFRGRCGASRSASRCIAFCLAFWPSHSVEPMRRLSPFAPWPVGRREHSVAWLEDCLIPCSSIYGACRRQRRLFFAQLRLLQLCAEQGAWRDLTEETARATGRGFGPT